MVVKVFLVGRVLLEVDGEVVIDERKLRGRQGRHAFAYLVCERTRPITREALASSLWEQNLAPSWEVSLSAIVSSFARPLSSSRLKSLGIWLSRGFGQYQLHLPLDAWIDVETCTSAIDRAESALRSGNTGAILGPATVAATIARRPFLSGIEGDWVELQRRRLQRQLVRALNCLSKMWLLTGEPQLAVETSTEAIAIDPMQESSYQLLMQAYADMGERPKALGIYYQLKDLLGLELGTEPAIETRALYSRLSG